MCVLIIAITVGPPYTLRLKVKFYSSEPNTLREELTRYQFFLQLKQDLLEGRLHSKTTDLNPNIVSFEEKCAELCALSLQCKCHFISFSPSVFFFLDLVLPFFRCSFFSCLDFYIRISDIIDRIALTNACFF